MKIYIYLFFLFLLASCEDKISFVSSLDSFLANTTENYKKYDVNAWAESDSMFNKYVKTDLEKWRPELSKAEVAHVNELIGRYYAIRVKAGINNFENGVNNLLQQTGSFIKELANDTTNKVENK